MQTNPYTIDLGAAWRDVHEFNCEIADRTDRWYIGKPGGPKLVKLSRISLIFEEGIREAAKAEEEGNVLELLDGAVDLLYVILGGSAEIGFIGDSLALGVGSRGQPRGNNFNSFAASSAIAITAVVSEMFEDFVDAIAIWNEAVKLHGLPVGAAWDEVHAANMRKFLPGGWYDKSLQKWRKPSDWVGPDITGILEKYPIKHEQ